MKNAVVSPLLLAAALLFVADAARASCSARVICNVTVIECSGQSACYSGSDWVQCDDQPRITCPICQAQTTCCDGRFLYCNGWESCEDSPGNWVRCDGQLQGICPDCPNWGSAAPGVFEGSTSAAPAGRLAFCGE